MCMAAIPSEQENYRLQRLKIKLRENLKQFSCDLHNKKGTYLY
jgi:hypothetical protein